MEIAVQLVWFVGFTQGCVAPPDALRRAGQDSPVEEITFVEFPPSGVESWHFEKEPRVSIGVVAGQPAYEFSNIVGVGRLPDGYVVGDAIAGELRRFDTRGTHVGTVGGAGQGPGEFASLTWLEVSADHKVLAWDFRTRRLTTYGPDLELIGTQVVAPNDIYVVAGAFQADRLLLWPFAGSRIQEVAAPEVVEAWSYLAVVGLEAPAALDTIVRVPARLSYVTPDATLVRLPLTTGPSYAVGSSYLWAGNGTTGRLIRYSTTGDEELSLLLPSGGPVSQEYVDAYVAVDLKRYSGGERRQRARLFSSMPMPDSLPSFDKLLIDDEDNLWIRTYTLVEASVQSWVIVSRSGRPLASLNAPHEFDLRSVRTGEVLGIWRDEFGVETVRSYMLVKP